MRQHYHYWVDYKDNIGFLTDYHYPVYLKIEKSNPVKDKAVLQPRVSPAFAITYFCNYCNIRFDPISAKTWNQRSLTPRWPLTPCLLRSHVWLYPRIIVTKSHENTSKYVDTVTLFSKTWTKGHWPLDDFDPTSVEVTCVTLPKDHCVQDPWEYINVCGYSDQFSEKIPHTIVYTYYSPPK